MIRTSRTRAVTAVASAVGAAVLALGATAAPAQSAPARSDAPVKAAAPVLPAGAVALPSGARGPEQCPDGAMCFWEGANFSGNGWALAKPSNGLQCQGAVPQGFSAPRSAYNRTNGNMALYRGGSCIGVWQIGVLSPGYAYGDVDPNRIYAWNWTL
ncbi:peptidase inhibitor family I36 protein [Streptomyces sp. NPDC020965]|uniref:peptidase inhibitor family I36 protein n=1 Tax=Streptomyces sp. NPDC020965 TaxID=3365105 RepID=UPI0037960A86